MVVEMVRCWLWALGSPLKGDITIITCWYPGRMPAALQSPSHNSVNKSFFPFHRRGNKGFESNLPKLTNYTISMKEQGSNFRPIFKCFFLKKTNKHKPLLHGFFTRLRSLPVLHNAGPLSPTHHGTSKVLSEFSNIRKPRFLFVCLFFKIESGHATLLQPYKHSQNSLATKFNPVCKTLVSIFLSQLFLFSCSLCG